MILLIGNLTYASPSLWAEEEVERAESLNLLPNRVKGNYQRDITREEFCSLVVRLYQVIAGVELDNINIKPFVDTNNPDVLKAYDLGIINGIGNSRFAPEEPVNREQIATMFFRMLSVIDEDIFYQNYRFPFKDIGATSDWSMNAIGFMNQKSIIKGYPDDEFKPKNRTSVE